MPEKKNSGTCWVVLECDVDELVKVREVLTKIMDMTPPAFALTMTAKIKRPDGDALRYESSRYIALSTGMLAKSMGDYQPRFFFFCGQMAVKYVKPLVTRKMPGCFMKFLRHGQCSLSTMMSAGRVHKYHC